MDRTQARTQWHSPCNRQATVKSSLKLLINNDYLIFESRCWSFVYVYIGIHNHNNYIHIKNKTISPSTLGIGHKRKIIHDCPRSHFWTTVWKFALPWNVLFSIAIDRRSIIKTKLIFLGGRSIDKKSQYICTLIAQDVREMG